MPADWVPANFIDEPIEAEFDRPPMLSRKPGAPNGFVWRGERFRVEQTLASWFDYARKGRSAKNMQPAHARVAAQRGSWGVGRFYFRVRAGGRVFDLYYDRAPEGAGDRQGHWFLYREMKPA
ncbi:MAG: hypothetical protein A2Y93_13565 [Chloroflexi bacterium RBG_13_68_17]|nr:MAG: hypothetical protein A2Y93_13565 [Chloroflexi bacterium RBG_13_68_17]